MIVEWDPARPRKKVATLIKEGLESGAIIGYPTDTFYGLGCDLFNIKAIKTLYAMKGLSEKRPLSLIFRDIKDISNYAVLTDFAFQILKSTLPGAYTFILKAKRIVPRLLQTAKKEVGVRMPNHAVPLSLVSLLERPIINTTAKLIGQEAFGDPRDIERYFGGRIAFVVDGGLIVGEPSTVISLVDDRVNVLREGKGGPYRSPSELASGEVRASSISLSNPSPNSSPSLAPHPLHKSLHGPWIVLVEAAERARVQKAFHPPLLALEHGDAGEHARHVP